LVEQFSVVTPATQHNHQQIAGSAQPMGDLILTNVTDLDPHIAQLHAALINSSPETTILLELWAD
jgi:hypothetical protein